MPACHFTPSAVTMMSMTLMPMNGAIDPAEAVDQQVAPQHGRGGLGPELDALQRQRHEGDDDRAR